MNFSLHLMIALALLLGAPALRADDHAASPGYLGFTYRFLDSNFVQAADVAPDSPAAKAGLKPGDKIRRIGTTEMGYGADVYSIIMRLPPGSQITIEIADGLFKRKTLTATVGTDPARRSRPTVASTTTAPAITPVSTPASAVAPIPARASGTIDLSVLQPDTREAVAKVEAWTAALAPPFKPEFTWSLGKNGLATMNKTGCTNAPHTVEISYEPGSDLHQVRRYVGGSFGCFPGGAGRIEYRDGSVWTVLSV